MVTKTRAVLGVVLAGVILTGLSGDVAHVAAGLAFVLALVTPSLAVVGAGLVIAGLFGFVEIAVNWLEGTPLNPAFRYAAVFIVGVLAGKIEAKILRGVPV